MTCARLSFDPSLIGTCTRYPCNQKDAMVPSVQMLGKGFISFRLVLRFSRRIHMSGVLLLCRCAGCVTSRAACAVRYCASRPPQELLGGCTNGCVTQWRTAHLPLRAVVGRLPCPFPLLSTRCLTLVVDPRFGLGGGGACFNFRPVVGVYEVLNQGFGHHVLDGSVVVANRPYCCLQLFFGHNHLSLLGLACRADALDFALPWTGYFLLPAVFPGLDGRRRTLFHSCCDFVLRLVVAVSLLLPVAGHQCGISRNADPHQVDSEQLSESLLIRCRITSALVCPVGLSSCLSGFTPLVLV